MASIDSATRGSIAEHDIVISISEEAINRQFDLLYTKLIRENKSLPPPPGLKLKSGVVTTPSKYLINHDLNIFDIYTDKNGARKFDPEAGIFGHIKCPTISLKEAESNTARITFEFQRDATAPIPDSVFKEWVGRGREAEIKPTTINGWKMSWKVKLGENKFGDFKKELTQPAEDDNKPNTAHPDTLKALNAVNPSHFTVSAIFCIFEDALISNTFELRDASNNIRENTTNFMKAVANYFTDLQRAVNPGTATADHPYVLGYGLAQKVPDLREIDPLLETDKTPKYFIPKEYRITCTPGYIYDNSQKTPIRKDSPYSNGTLNFCILTFREPKDDDPVRPLSKVDVAQNANSGKLAQSLFDLTKTKEHDGIMGFARDLVLDRFIAPMVVDAYFIDPKEVIPDKGKVEGWEESFTPSKSIDGSPPVFVSKTEFDMSGGKWNLILKNDTTSTKGFSQTTVTWVSDLQTNSANISKKDAVRRAYVKIVNQVKMDCKYTNTGVVKDDTYTTTIDVACKYGLIVTAGKGGRIDIIKDDNATTIPEIKDGKLELKRGPRGENDYGAYVTTSNDESLAWEIVKAIITTGGSGSNPWVEHLQRAILNGISDKIRKNIEAKANAAFDSMKNRVIMPAGNVFNYAGVDVDTQGNMFTHISFALGQENVSQTGGGKPEELSGKK